MEEPPGFGIRYIWTAQIDGPGLQSGLRSREYITPYRPIIVSTEGKTQHLIFAKLLLLTLLFCCFYVYRKGMDL